MIVKIQVRDSAGAFRYRDANVGEFAETSLSTILDDGASAYWDSDGWRWLRQWLCTVCIRRAEKVASSSPEKADLWFKRYQQIRGIE